jgi:hypothetical protein
MEFEEQWKEIKRAFAFYVTLIYLHVPCLTFYGGV